MKHIVINRSGAAIRWWTKIKFIKIFRELLIITYSFSSSSNSLLIRFSAMLGDTIYNQLDILYATRWVFKMLYRKKKERERSRKKKKVFFLFLYLYQCAFFLLLLIEGKKTTMSTKRKRLRQAFAAERKFASTYVLMVKKKNK
jgi:hypothetical protein